MNYEKKLKMAKANNKKLEQILQHEIDLVIISFIAGMWAMVNAYDNTQNCTIPRQILAIVAADLPEYAIKQ